MGEDSIVNGSLTVSQAGELLGVSRQRIHQMISEGKIKADRLGSINILNLADIEALLELRKK